MPNVPCRQQFIFHHDSADSDTLVAHVRTALAQVVASGRPMQVVRLVADTTPDQQGHHVVVVLDAPLGWEIAADPLLRELGLSCRRYL